VDDKGYKQRSGELAKWASRLSFSRELLWPVYAQKEKNARKEQYQKY
jgi:hypothetical protein